MNVNIYLEDSLAKPLEKCVHQLGQSRNAIIREAIREWLVHHERKQWAPSVMKFQGVKEAEPFESYRSDLSPPNEDPLR